MMCLITALIRFANKKTTRKKTKKAKLKKLTAKTQYLNLKAPGNNVKKQSDNTLTAQISFYLRYTADGIFPQ